MTIDGVDDRTLPPELIAALRGVQDLARLADDWVQEHRAWAALGALMLAAVHAGWHVSEIADALGMGRSTAYARVWAARRRYGLTSPALIVDAPLDKPPHPLAVLELPVEQREWLTRVEAADMAGLSVAAVGKWLAGGLLPNTAGTQRHRLFLRADITRVISAPRRTGGVNFDAVRDQIRRNGI